MYRLIDLSKANEWNLLLEKLPTTQRDIYFTPEYYYINESNGYGKALCFVYEQDKETILYPFLRNEIDFLKDYNLSGKECKTWYDIQGAYGYNGIVTSTDDASHIDSFYRCFDQWCQENNIVAEFVRYHPLLKNYTKVSPRMKTFYTRPTVKLDLRPSADDIWMNSFSTKNRNVIRKAEKDGVIIVETNDYATFKDMYDQTMTNVHARDSYYFPQQYYENIKDCLGEKAFLCFALLDGKPIAASIFLVFGDYSHYHLSARDKDHHKIAATNLLLWHGIQKCKLRGCKWMHFGGGITEEDNDHLLHFKRNFSKETAEYWFGKHVHNQEAYDEIIERWKEKQPENYKLYKTLLLGYRET